MIVLALVERFLVKLLVGAAVASMMAVAFPGAARPANPSATLAVSDVQTPPGATVSVPVELDNPDDQVRGLQFTVIPSSAVTYTAVRAVDRGVGLTADANQQSDGSIIVVLISLGTQTIAPGNGRVLSVDVTPVLAPDLITLDLADVRIAGSDGPLSNMAESGHIRIQSAAPAGDGTGGGGSGGGGGGGCTAVATTGHSSCGILLGVVAALLLLRRACRSKR